MIDTYADLLEAIPAWLNKHQLEGRAADFIRLAETDMESKLRSREMQKTVEADVTCPTVNLPADWLEASRLWLAGSLEPLRFVTPDEILSHRSAATPADLPPATGFYSLHDNLIELSPVPGLPVKLWLTYYARIPRLDAAHQTNWLTVRDPGVYLYGALTQAAPYLLDDERVATWGREYAARIQQLNTSSQIALHSGSPLVRRIRGFGKRPTRVYGAAP